MHGQQECATFICQPRVAPPVPLREACFSHISHDEWPADAFYEWKVIEGLKASSLMHTCRDSQPILFAGL